jgi:hypothetical protein
MNSRLLLLSVGAFAAAACATPPVPVSTYVGERGQVGSITGSPGKRSLSIVAAGNAALGAGVQADCELRAKETGAGGTWQLVPFKSDTMEVDDRDVRSLRFSLSIQADKTFSIVTNFSERNCGAGLTFSGQYRRS